jgi:hypothetical protein
MVEACAPYWTQSALGQRQSSDVNRRFDETDRPDHHVEGAVTFP